MYTSFIVIFDYRNCRQVKWMAPCGRNDGAARRLWALSAELVGIDEECTALKDSNANLTNELALKEKHVYETCI